MDRHKIILINFNEEKKYQFIIEDFTPDTKIFLTEHKLIYSSSYSLTFVLIADPREEYFSVHDLSAIDSSRCFREMCTADHWNLLRGKIPKIHR